jgi:hypothetical protein
LLFVFLGFVWLVCFRRYFERLQDLPLTAFLVTKEKSGDEENVNKTAENALREAN